jgi:outer membrane protein assembly factor BamB
MLTILAWASGLARAGDWPQGFGPSGDLRAADADAPTSWSVALGRNIAWKITLPETGQSTPVIVGHRVFLSTMKEVDRDSKLGSDIVAWCCDARTGAILWQRPIAGQYPLRISGCFSDSCTPPAVCDGQRVCFINASGTIACFDLDGKPLWSKSILSVGRTQPFLLDGKMIYIRQNYAPEADGEFPPTHENAPPDQWTQLQALDLKTGEIAWTSTCGVNMGNVPIPQKLSDGRTVIVVGRGGGHGPPEKPEGISMIDGSSGKTIWTLPLEGFMSTMTIPVRSDRVHFFHGPEHLTVDASGKIVSRVSILKDVPVRRWIDNAYTDRTETIADKGDRMIIQQSNLLVGGYHYFRSYTQPYLGRVNVDNDRVEYLELPLQVARAAGKPDEKLWYTPPPAGKKGGEKPKPIQFQTIAENAMKDSRGFVVMGDARSRGNGWGHHATALMTAVGPNLYVPTMSGNVYVIQWKAPKLDEHALLAINDLGPVGQSWTRASLSFGDGHLFAHTIRELICIGAGQ